MAHRCSPAALWFFLAVLLLWNHEQTAELLRDALSLAEADTAMWSAIKPNSVLIPCLTGFSFQTVQPLWNYWCFFSLHDSITWFYMTSYNNIFPRDFVSTASLILPFNLVLYVFFPNECIGLHCTFSCLRWPKQICSLRGRWWTGLQPSKINTGDLADAGWTVYEWGEFLCSIFTQQSRRFIPFGKNSLGFGFQLNAALHCSGWRDVKLEMFAL